MNTLLQNGLRLPTTRILQDVLIELHFPHVVAIWKPAALETLGDGSVNSGLLVADTGYEFVSAAQRCFYNATPEYSEAEVMGRTRVNNIFTLDVFLFPEGVELADKWIIYNRTPGDNEDRLFVLAGAPQSVQPGALHHMGGQRALVARIQTTANNLPPGVDLSVLGILPATGGSFGASQGGTE